MGMRGENFEKTDNENVLSILKAMFDAISDAIHVVGPDLRILIRNKAYLDLALSVGINEDILGRPLFEAFPFLQPSVEEEYRKVFETGEIIKTQDKTLIGGKEYFTETSKIPLFEGEKVTRVMTILRDITEWKVAGQLKSNFITFASHELKTPLIPILGWADFIQSAVEKGKDIQDIVTIEMLQSIIRNSQRLRKIIDNYLDVGHIESGHFALEKKAAHLSELISEAINSIAGSAKKKNITIHHDFPDPELIVDPFRIEQVFINILSNAIAYSPPKTQIWIRAVEEGDTICISFEDHGIGFDLDEISKAMEPFSVSSLKNKGNSIFTGSHVGLYICKSIVESHRGTITIESPGINKGTTVFISLPRGFNEEDNIAGEREEEN